MNRTLLAIASPRNGTIGIHAKGRQDHKRCQISHEVDPGHWAILCRCSADEKSSVLGPEALGPGAWASCDLTGALVSVARRRHRGCRRFFGSVGRVLAQARKRK